MWNTTIIFNTKGYDSFIDFIKAYAILCVLFGHAFGFLLDKVAYGVWAGMQVPLFILIQSFHCYKKENVKINLWKLTRRIIIPFIILEIITFSILILIDKGDCIHVIINGLNRGGYGPGSYFPWIYIQVAILLPLFIYGLKRWNKYVSLIVFFLICEGFEVAFSLIGISENWYRLLAMRYIFLFYFGWLWTKEGVKINGITILLSLLSLISIIYFEYFSVDDEPWFVVTGFSFHRWPCYYWVAYGLTALLHLLWKKINGNGIIMKYVKILATSSYEIFLIQMSIFLLLPPLVKHFITNPYLSIIILIPSEIVLSIWLGIELNQRVMVKINSSK